MYMHKSIHNSHSQNSIHKTVIQNSHVKKSPWRYTQQQMRQLSNILRICTITIEEMPLVNNLLQLSIHIPIIPITHFNQPVA